MASHLGILGISCIGEKVGIDKSIRFEAPDLITTTESLPIWSDSKVAVGEEMNFSLKYNRCESLLILVCVSITNFRVFMSVSLGNENSKNCSFGPSTITVNLISVEEDAMMRKDDNERRE